MFSGQWIHPKPDRKGGRQGVARRSAMKFSNGQVLPAISLTDGLLCQGSPLFAVHGFKIALERTGEVSLSAAARMVGALRWSKGLCSSSAVFEPPAERYVGRLSATRSGTLDREACC